LDRENGMLTEPRQTQVTKLLVQHRTSLYSYILACVRNHTDAEDVFQEVSVAIIESMGDLREESGFLPWSREIARRRMLAHFRDSRRERVVDPEVATRLAEAADRLEQVQPASAHREALMACLEKLPAENRQLILMRYGGSATGVGELAAKVNRSLSATYALIKRIKTSLRECVNHRLSVEKT
jgi:RNA polymerase sigma-70 factor (ECF subfamily)